MLRMRDSEGFSSGGSEDSSGCAESSWVRRLVARGASVEMYTADLDKPWGAGSCDASNSVRSNCVFPAPLIYDQCMHKADRLYESRWLIPFTSYLDQVARTDTAQ